MGICIAEGCVESHYTLVMVIKNHTHHHRLVSKHFVLKTLAIRLLRYPSTLNSLWHIYGCMSGQLTQSLKRKEVLGPLYLSLIIHCQW